MMSLKAAFKTRQYQFAQRERTRRAAIGAWTQSQRKKRIANGLPLFFSQWSTKRCGTIKATVTKTANESEFLELAITRNSSHGLQLSQQDKRDMARKIYSATPEKERLAKKKTLAKILSVSERTIRDWLSRMDKDAKEARNQRIFQMWLACYSRAAIGAWTQSQRKKRIANGLPLFFSQWSTKRCGTT